MGIIHIQQMKIFMHNLTSVDPYQYTDGCLLKNRVESSMGKKFNEASLQS